MRVLSYRFGRSLIFFDFNISIRVYQATGISMVGKAMAKIRKIVIEFETTPREGRARRVGPRERRVVATFSLRQQFLDKCLHVSTNATHISRKNLGIVEEQCAVCHKAYGPDFFMDPRADGPTDKGLIDKIPPL